MHHLADYPPAIYDLIAQLGLPYDVHVHDYAWFCPRMSLVAAHNRYCGEPDLPDCEACVADNGIFSRKRSESRRCGSAPPLFSPARAAWWCRPMMSASACGGISGRYRPSPSRTRTTTATDAPQRGPDASRAGRPRVCVVGAIGVHKGYEVLLACARDAERRDLDLEFVVVGHTIDDARLMATGRVFVTGQFDPDEAVEPDRCAKCDAWLRPFDLPGNMVSGPGRALARRVCTPPHSTSARQPSE